jgi:hypothetical protein
LVISGCKSRYSCNPCLLTLTLVISGCKSRYSCNPWLLTLTLVISGCKSSQWRIRCNITVCRLRKVDEFVAINLIISINKIARYDIAEILLMQSNSILFVINLLSCIIATGTFVTLIWTCHFFERHYWFSYWANHQI